MPSRNNEFLQYVLEMLEPMGPVKGRAMFGGHGIFMGGVMFALIADDLLYFKADDDTKQSFEQEGMKPFVYSRNGKDIIMSYYECPDGALEDPNEMQLWADKAYKTAAKAAASKKPKKRP